MVDKQYSRMKLMGIVLVIIWIVLIISYKEKSNMETTGFIVITFLITIAVVYAFIYSAILIKKRENEVYYVTNKRIFIVKENAGDITHKTNLLTVQTARRLVVCAIVYKFKLLCIDLYKSGINPDTPNVTSIVREILNHHTLIVFNISL